MGRAPLLLLLTLAGGLAQAGDSRALAALERLSGGRLGVMALDTGSGRTLAHRAGERFLLCSTFKLLLAAQVLKGVDEGRETLDRLLPYGPADLIANSPTTARRVAEGGMTMAALCEAAVTESDNTAANLLLARVGGPASLTRFLRALGDPVTRLDRNEPALNHPVPGRPYDTTTPEAMLGTLRTLLLGNVLSAASRDQLLRWLLATNTGGARLRAGLPAGWRLAHKTGTGVNGATNDIGLLYPPGRAPILVAAYYTGAKISQTRRDAVLAEVARLVAKDNASGN
jgi:beta-lactamase class A